MKKNILLVLLAIFFANIYNLKAQCDQGKYVVGYMPDWAGDASSIQYDKLSHIIYAFVLPTSSGGITSLQNPGKLQQIVSYAHAQNTKVLIAVGGWNNGDDSGFRALAENSSTRAAFVSNMVSFVNQYQLDGVDIDWEYPLEGTEPANSASLMSELAAALRPKGKLLTAAVVAQGWTGTGVLNSVFNDVDFLNLMAYDGGDGEMHSPYSLAESSLNYWLNRGLPASKAVLGVPFYGRPSWKAYNVLLSEGANPNSDIFNGVYYNGIPTIKQKAELGKSKGAGIMIWELTQDATGANSLLSAINTVIKPCKGNNNGNTHPSVSLVAPANGKVYTSPATVNLEATASDALPGKVVRVEFYNGNVKIGARTIAPYTYRWENVGPGTYTITAKAYDNEGAVTTSESRTITVTGSNTAPVVSLIAPANGKVYTAPAIVDLEATASDAAPGYIVKVEFFHGSTKIGQRTLSRYTYRWQNVQQGTYVITAKATDNQGAVTVSAGRTITVTGTGNPGPTVSLTSPAAGATFTAPAKVVITADASDVAPGYISKVDFYNGATLLASDNTAPYSYDWTGVPAGTYTVRAVATDNQGGTNTASRSITVNPSSTCTVAAWDASSVYTIGMQALKDGKIYTARWWTQSQDPATNSCPDCVWRLEGPCGAARLGEGEAVTGISIYPSLIQSGNKLNIELDNQYENVQVVLSGIDGSKGYRYSYKNLQTLQLDLPNLPKGMILIKVTVGSKTIIKKLVHK